LCQATTVNLTHDGETFSVLFSSQRSGSPQVFWPIVPTAPAADGFTDVMSLFFASNSHDDSTSSTHAAEIWGDFNYGLTGTVAIKSDQIRIIVRATAYMSFAHREVFVNYTDLAGANYYDKTLTVVYTLGVDQNGALQVTDN